MTKAIKRDDFEKLKTARIEDLQQVYEAIDASDRPRLPKEKSVWHDELLALKEAMKFLRKVKS